MAIQHSHMISNRLDSAYLQQGGFSQANQRRNQRLTDQHGRRYFAIIEIRSGDPVGPIEPMFDAPLKVPQMYLRKSPDIDAPTQLIIDYPRWIEDLTSARVEWERRGRELSRKQFGSAYDPTKHQFKQEILDILGPPPQPVEPVHAALQGNRWVLGFTRRVDARLAQFFDAPEERGLEIDYSRYDFRDDVDAVDDEEHEAERAVASPVNVPPAAPNGARPTPAPRGSSSPAGFDYEAAAARIPDGPSDDDLAMRLDEDDELEAQFRRQGETPTERVSVAPEAALRPKPKRSYHKKKPAPQPSESMRVDVENAPVVHGE